MGAEGTMGSCGGVKPAVTMAVFGRMKLGNPVAKWWLIEQNLIQRWIGFRFFREIIMLMDNIHHLE